MSTAFKRFCAGWQCIDGSIMIVTALAVTILLSAGGAAYDIGRQQLVRVKLQQASDIASLAASTMPQGTRARRREAEALRYYNLNFPPSFLGVNRPIPEIRVGATVSVTASATMPTSFISSVGIDRLPVQSRTQTTLNASKTDFDMVAVIDESGSTWAGCLACDGLSRMEVEKKALTSMLNIIFPRGAPVNPDARFGLIGYTQHISNKWGLTSDRSQALNTIDRLKPREANYDHFGLEAGFNMITGANTSGANGTIDVIRKEMSQDCFYNTIPLINPWLTTPLAAGHPCIRVNGTCGMPNPPCRTDVRMAADRNTEVPPPRTARSDGEPTSPVKYMIFITDGFIMEEPSNCLSGPFSYGEHPIPGMPIGGANCKNYAAFLQQCTRIKDAGVTLYTISFASRSVGDEATLKACASVNPTTNEPRYLFAPDAATLQKHLQNIGQTVVKARVVQ